MLATSTEYFITSTTPGLRFCFSMLSFAIPGQFTFSNIQGTLNDFTVGDISYSHEKDKYHFTNMHISWWPDELLNKRIVISNIKIDETTINVNTTSGGDTPFSTSFLQPLIIRHVFSGKTTVTVNNKTLVDATNTDIKQDYHYQITTEQNDYFITTNIYNGSINGTINLEWTPIFNLTSSLQLQDINLDKISSDISGKTNMALNANISTDGVKHKLDFQFNHLNGKLNHYPISGNGHIHYDNDALIIEPSEIKIANASAKISGAVKQAWDLQWHVNIPNLNVLFSNLHGSITTNGKISGARNHPLLTGNLQLPSLIMNDISSPLFQHISHTKADFISALTLSDSALNTIISADTKITTGQLSLPGLGIQIKNIKLDSHYKHDALEANASFQSGNGNGRIQGNMHFLPQLQLALTLNGKDLQVANLPEYSIYATPDMSLAWNATQTHIQGNIFIPKADISPVDTSETASLSNDIVFVNSPSDKKVIPSQLSLQTQITLGDAVNLSHENLQTKVKGSVTISQTPGRQPVASGQLTLSDGTYKAYGKQLLIQNGRIIYTGNVLTNPGLDISAVKKFNTIAMSNANQFNGKKGLPQTYAGTDSIAVGVQVKGTIKKPVVTLFSSPSGMSQNNIMSYLLFGYPQSELSGDNKLALLSAASALKLGKMNIGSITNKIQNFTGLTELNVESTQIYNVNTNSTHNETALSLGKKLSDKLSVHYSVGLYTSAAMLNIRYQLTKRLMLQTETSYLENGIDLRYGFERD